MVKRTINTVNSTVSQRDLAERFQAAVASRADQAMTARQRRRIDCMRRVLAGETCPAVAENVGVDATTVQRWLRQLKRDGKVFYKPNRRKQGRRGPPRPKGATLVVTGVAMDELLAAIADERRDWARQRLQGLADVMAGHSFTGAGRRAGVAGSLVRHWIKIAMRHGWQALTRQRQPRVMPIAPDRVVALQAELRTRLLASKEIRERLRLDCALRVLEGESIKAVAASRNVSPVSLDHWMAQLRRGGIAALLSKRPAPKPSLHADPGSLRTLAASEADRDVRRAIEALAHLAEGRGAFDAALRAKTTTHRVRQWAAAYREGGIAAVREARLNGSINQA